MMSETSRQHGIVAALLDLILRPLISMPVAGSLIQQLHSQLGPLEPVLEIDGFVLVRLPWSF